MLDMASLVREILQDDPGIDPQVFAALQPEYVVSEPPLLVSTQTPLSSFPWLSCCRVS